jgi:RNA polymerase sigma-70 factor (ECF subfamily)
MSSTKIDNKPKTELPAKLRKEPDNMAGLIVARPFLCAGTGLEKMSKTSFFCHVFANPAFIVMMTAGTNSNLARKRRFDLEYRNNRSENLIEKAKAEPEAFVKVFRSNYDTVFRYCARRLFDRHAAEDITSIVFFKVMKKIGSFEGNETDFRNWLLRIATNAVNDHLRSAKRRAEAIRTAAENIRSESSFVIGTDECLEEKKALLKQALLSLKPKYQTVIALRFFESMKLTEIAEQK